MGQILLTTEEVSGVAGRFYTGSACNYHACARAAAKAQLKKVKGKIAVVEMPNLPHKATGYNVDGKSYIALAMLKEDWQALLKEVEE